MCGVSGIVEKSGGSVARRDRAMTDPIAHRGPDGHGYYFGRGFAFGHRRLSIIDLSEQGRQPMSYGGRYWITYNGEIYNYLELRAELAGLGHAFSSAHGYGGHPRCLRTMGPGLPPAFQRHVGVRASTIPHCRRSSWRVTASA